MRSNIGSSAQWMSSKKRMSGCTSASVLMTSRAAHEISCGLRSPSTASSSPEASPIRSATASSSQHARSFSNASSSGSSSVIPTADLIISASGQYVTLSPYGRQRPLSTLAPSTESTNSRTSRLLPTPGSP